jgi:NAD(P)-dependent dehydrogenase (short-subunit alcohol dehydrogenase family)
VDRKRSDAVADQENIAASPKPLAGQVAIVTGGGRGLGRAFALALAQAGAAVAVTARTASEIHAVQAEIEQRGGRALAVAADVTNPQAVAQMVATVEQKLGPVDLLVNNAGVLHALGRVVEVEEDDWWREIEINVRGPFLCTKAVLPGMLARQRGRIINLASGAGLNAIDGGSAYCLSKAALIRFSEQLAVEVGEQGIAVFAIDPGTVRTPMNQYLHDSEIVGQRTPWVQQWFRQLYAEQRDMPIERLVELVLFLASGQADALSGRFISVRDDIHGMLSNADEIQRKDLYAMRLQRLEDSTG